jgi:hypothetical protein
MNELWRTAYQVLRGAWAAWLDEGHAAPGWARVVAGVRRAA